MTSVASLQSSMPAHCFDSWPAKCRGAGVLGIGRRRQSRRGRVGTRPATSGNKICGRRAPARHEPRTARHRCAPPLTASASAAATSGKRANRSARKTRQRIGIGIDPGREVDERFGRAREQAPGGAEIAAMQQRFVSAADRRTMSVALALIAMLIELCFGYPERLLRAIGHPVTLIGHLIGALDRMLNRDRAASAERRAAGMLALLIVLGIVGVDFRSRCVRAAAPSVRPSRRGHPCQHARRATKPAPTRSGCRRGAGNGRHCRRPRRRGAYRRPRHRTRSTPPASRARPSRASRRISPMPWSRRSSGWPSPDSLAPHSTRRSTPPTV